jgi:hypothetical protein
VNDMRQFALFRCPAEVTVVLLIKSRSQRTVPGAKSVRLPEPSHSRLRQSWE